MKTIVLVIILGSIMVTSCANEKNKSDNTVGESPIEMTIPEPTLSTQNYETAPTSTPSPIIPSSTPGSIGMNPAHGQPGHRCDIAVGAPLNSAPSTPASVPSITPPVLGKASTPVPSAVGSSATVTQPGMNPPHGQPGHDCAIAVGAPLKK